MRIGVARLGHDHPSHPSHRKEQAALCVVLGKQDLVCAGGWSQCANVTFPVVGPRPYRSCIWLCLLAPAVADLRGLNILGRAAGSVSVLTALNVLHKNGTLK